MKEIYTYITRVKQSGSVSAKSLDLLLTGWTRESQCNALVRAVACVTAWVCVCILDHTSTFIIIVIMRDDTGEILFQSFLGLSQKSQGEGEANFIKPKV